ncbi:hypothetical protein V500_07634 [Pseudogymnoascus sp. VKM F-4518 (FW-2643)]|nr:hypothetical protein V500_07634 [Pseudogymnoascus sp. VKM F-4518 (FW-2643)]
MPLPTTASDLIFSEQANHNFSKTLGDIKRHTLSIHNRLQSILVDAAFVQSVSEAYCRPLVANERCGSWYINPEAKSGSTYFKSTDGHTGVWKFSTRRLNTHLLELIGKGDGCIIVDSTRRGKRMPDALSKTIPIWCSVINRSLFPTKPEYHNLYTPPQAVSSSEHAQIAARLVDFAESFASLGIDMKPLREHISKPIRPIWVTPESALPVEEQVFSDYHPVICCTASRRVAGGEVSEGGYIQGSGDDTENWAYGLTPTVFWPNSELLLSTPESELPSLIAELVSSFSNTNTSKPSPTLLPPTSSLYVTSSTSLAAQAAGDSDIIITICSEITAPESWQKDKHELKIGIGSGKIGSRNLRSALPHIIDFVKRSLLTASAETKSPRVVVACPNGKDLSIGVALAILCILYDDKGDFLELGQEATNLATTRAGYPHMATGDNPPTAGFGSKKRKAGDSPEPTSAWPGGKKRKKKVKSTRTSSGAKRKYKKSAFAKIFGTAPVLNNGESGWTPINLQHRPSWRQFRTEEAKRNEQRRRLFGFDSNQLQAIDAVPALIKDQTPLLKLDNPIHPILALRHWRSRESIPANRAFWRIGNGRPGYWEAHNPFVWEILEPILKLASQFLINSHISHWWDTLLHGERRVFESPFMNGLRTIHRRPVEVFYANRGQVRSELAEASGLMSFGIESGVVNVSTGLGPSRHEPEDNDQSYYAYTMKHDILGVDPVEVSLDRQLFKPFLRENLTQAERLGLQFFIASIIVHEIGHAIGDLFRRQNSDVEGKYPWEELFFEEEALAEHGYSLTMANMNYIVERVPVEPFPLTYFAHQWPRHDGNDIGHILSHPIPLFARKDFWSSFVQVYGETGQALYLGQLASGSQLSNIGMSNRRWKWQPPVPHAPALPLNINSQDSIIAHTIQTRRIQNQNLAMTALTTTRGALSDWRAKFLSKKEKHEWYETQREREQMGIDGLPPEPDSPLSVLTAFSSDVSDPDDQSGNESDFSHESTPSNVAPERLFIHPKGTIDITILSTGWPSDQELLPHPRPPLPPLYRDPAHLAIDVSDFRTFSLDQETWRMREAPPRAPRFMFVDIDSEDIRTYFNSFQDERMEVDADVFAHVVAACPDMWVPGPPGVLRFVGPEPWEGAKSGKLWEPPEPTDTEMIDAGAGGVEMEM